MNRFDTMVLSVSTNTCMLLHIILFHSIFWSDMNIPFVNYIEFITVVMYVFATGYLLLRFFRTLKDEPSVNLSSKVYGALLFLILYSTIILFLMYQKSIFSFSGVAICSTILALIFIIFFSPLFSKENKNA